MAMPLQKSLNPLQLSAATLFQQFGTPHTPVILDVRLREDIDDDPRLLPCARVVAHTQIESLATQLGGNSKVVVYCQKGGKLSQGCAAILQHYGITAFSLEGGHFAWRDLGYPLIPLEYLERNSSYWVTASQPDIASLVSIWLLRRFIDPNAVMLFVEAKEVNATAERFGGTAVGQRESPQLSAEQLVMNLIERFSLSRSLFESVLDAVNAGGGHGFGLTAMIDGTRQLYPADIELANACLLIFDALYQWGQLSECRNTQTASCREEK